VIAVFGARLMFEQRKQTKYHASLNISEENLKQNQEKYKLSERWVKEKTP